MMLAQGLAWCTKECLRHCVLPGKVIDLDYYCDRIVEKMRTRKPTHSLSDMWLYETYVMMQIMQITADNRLKRFEVYDNIWRYVAFSRRIHGSLQLPVWPKLIVHNSNWHMLVHHRRTSAPMQAQGVDSGRRVDRQPGATFRPESQSHTTDGI